MTRWFKVSSNKLILYLIDGDFWLFIATFDIAISYITDPCRPHSNSYYVSGARRCRLFLRLNDMSSSYLLFSNGRRIRRAVVHVTAARGATVDIITIAITCPRDGGAAGRTCGGYEYYSAWPPRASQRKPSRRART